jgi:hypothetical protein
MSVQHLESPSLSEPVFFMSFFVILLDQPSDIGVGKDIV